MPDASPAAAWLADLDRRQRNVAATAEKAWQAEIDAARLDFASATGEYAVLIAAGSLHIHQLAARAKAIDAGRRLVSLQQRPPSTGKLYADTLRAIRPGEFGCIAKAPAEVFHVVDGGSALLKVEGDEVIWLDGIGGVVDKSLIWFSGVIEGTGPRTYETLLGSKTIWSYRRHPGTLPPPPQITPQPPDLTDLPPPPQPKTTPKKK